MSDIPLVRGGSVARSEGRQRNEESIQQTVNESQVTIYVRTALNCIGLDLEGYSVQDDGTIVCNGCHQNFGVLEPGDDVDKIHAQEKPDCSVLLSRRGKPFIKKHQTLKAMKEVKDLNTKDFEEINNMVEEQSKVLCETLEKNDRLEAENVRLKRELQDTRGSGRQGPVTEELLRENKFLSNRIRQQEVEIKTLKRKVQMMENEVRKSVIENIKFTVLKEEKDRILDLLKLKAGEMEKKQKKFQELQRKNKELEARLEKETQELKKENKLLSEEKDRIVDWLKLQAGEMEKKIKQCQELQKKCKENHGLVSEEARKACLFMGYTTEQVQAAKDKLIERHRTDAAGLMEILQEREDDKQCSGQGGRGELVVGGNQYRPDAADPIEILQEREDDKQCSGQGGRGELVVGGNQYIVPRSEAKVPQYALLWTRVGSYRGWRNTFQNPKALADAGMFFTGKEDGTRCFYCGITLMLWLATHEPWFEHARWSPECDYVRQRMGQDFINNVQEQVNQQNEVCSETEEVNKSSTEHQVVEDDVVQALPENGAGNAGNSGNPEGFDVESEKKVDK